MRLGLQLSDPDIANTDEFCVGSMIIQSSVFTRSLNVPLIEFEWNREFGFAEKLVHPAIDLPFQEGDFG